MPHCTLRGCRTVSPDRISLWPPFVLCFMHISIRCRGRHSSWIVNIPRECVLCECAVCCACVFSLTSPLQIGGANIQQQQQQQKTLDRQTKRNKKMSGHNSKRIIHYTVHKAHNTPTPTPHTYILPYYIYSPQCIRNWSYSIICVMSIEYLYSCCVIVFMCILYNIFIHL